MNSTITLQNAPLDISSIIQKFEALSRVHTANITLLQQPLKYPRVLLRYKAPAGPTKEQKAAIFSPTRKARGRFKNLVLDDKDRSWQDKVFNSRSKGDDNMVNQSGSRKLYPDHIRSAFPDPTNHHDLESSSVALYVRNRGPSNNIGGTVKDKISYFEGCGGNSTISCEIYLWSWNMADIVLS